MKLKPKYYKFLLKALIGIILSFTLLTTYRAVTSESEIVPTRIVKQHEQIADSHFIISEDMVMGKLTAKSQIVSMEQKIQDTYTDVDEGFLGDRETTLNVSGTYKFGLNTNDIDIKHIDQENGNVYIGLPKPVLISLELPFHKVDIEKTSGWLRLSMSEDEEKTFYKSIHKSIENELTSDDEVLNQANLNNQRVIKELLIGLPGVSDIIFEEGQL